MLSTGAVSSGKARYGRGIARSALRGYYPTRLATGVTARPTRTSWVPAGMILTRVHSTRPLPCAVKITPDP